MTPQRSAVLVTGSASGIGLACVARLAAMPGVEVFAAVRQVGSQGQVLEACGHSPHVTPLVLDITKEDDIGAAVKAVQGRRLAGLVNNAGIAVAGPLELVPPERLREQFEVNVFGQVAMAKAFLPLLRASGGRLVFVGSVNGAVSGPFLGPYSASKFALEALVDALREELRPGGVGVSLIEPGAIRTPIWEKSMAAAQDALRGADAQRLEPYRRQLTLLERQMARRASAAESPEIVVRAVCHALFARRPRARYCVGLESKLAFHALPLLPPWLRRRIILSKLGL